MKPGSRNSSGYLTDHLVNITIIFLVAQGVSQRQTYPSVTELLSGHSSVLDKMDKVQLQDLSQGHINTFLYLKRVQPNPSLSHLNSHTQKKKCVSLFGPEVKAAFFNRTVRCSVLGEMIVPFTDGPCTMLQTEELQYTIALSS